MSRLPKSSLFLFLLTICLLLPKPVQSADTTGGVLHEFDARLLNRYKSQADSKEYFVIFYLRQQSAAIDPNLQLLIVAFSDTSSPKFFPEDLKAFVDGAEIGDDPSAVPEKTRLALKVRVTPGQYRHASDLRRNWTSQVDVNRLAMLPSANAGAQQDGLELLCQAAKDPAALQQGAIAYAVAVASTIGMAAGPNPLPAGMTPQAFLQHLLAQNKAQAAVAVKPVVATPVPLEIHQDLQSELLLANQAGKRLLVEYSATWCPVCKKMDQTMQDPRVKSVMDGKIHFVKIQTDLNRRFDQSKDYYKVTGLPTFITYNANGSVRKRFTGGIPAEYFVQFLEK